MVVAVARSAASPRWAPPSCTRVDEPARRRLALPAVTPRPAVRPRHGLPHGRGAPFYTFAEIHYRTPQNWGHRPYVYLEFKGAGSGKLYTLAFNFGLGRNNEARYTFRDDAKGWKTLAFSTYHPESASGSTDWSNVRAVRIAFSKQGSRTLALGMPRLSGTVDRLGVPLPILQGTKAHEAAIRRAACVRGALLTHARRSCIERHWLELPVSSMSTSCRIYVASSAGYQQARPRW